MKFQREERCYGNQTPSPPGGESPELSDRDKKQKGCNTLKNGSFSETSCWCILREDGIRTYIGL